MKKSKVVAAGSPREWKVIADDGTVYDDTDPSVTDADDHAVIHLAASLLGQRVDRRVCRQIGCKYASAPRPARRR